jgi:aryl-alcohol dehydrogenase-like predicted oxidoreductase
VGRRDRLPELGADLPKFILGHPAVTCPIPASSNPAHLADDLGAGLGRLPDEALRWRMVQELAGG